MKLYVKTHLRVDDETRGKKIAWRLFSHKI